MAIMTFKKMDLSLFKRKSVKDLYSVFSATLALQVINVARGLIVAKFLGPGHYGVLKGVQLISMLDKFGSLGFKMVATREITHLRGTQEKEKEYEVRNVAYSGEIALSFLMFLVGIGSSFFFESKILISAIILASVGLFFSKISRIFETEAIIEKRFVLYSKIIFWVGFLDSILVVILVPSWGIYAVLSVAAVTSILTCFLYYRKLIFLYKFSLRKKELFRQLRIGIPLTLATLAYGSYRYAERITVVSILGIKLLGFYGLAAMAMDQVLNLLLLPVKIRKIDIYERLGQGRFLEVHRQVIKETLILIVIASILIPPSWVVIDVIISRFLVEYKDAGFICKIILFAVPFRVVSPYLNVVIVSAAVNKQYFIAPIQFAATIVFVSSVLILRYFNMATLVNIVIADVAGYAFYHLAYIILYKKCFMDVYLKKNKTVAIKTI